MTQPLLAAGLLAQTRDLLEGSLPAPWPGRQRDLAALDAARERLDRRYTVAVVGEFSSGKSFLLNALLGTLSRTGSRIGGLLAVDINPSTATITELEYGAETKATAYFPSGRSERVPVDGLSRFVAVAKDGPGSIHEAFTDDDGGPSRVVVEVNSAFLRRGFLLADTPGLASLNPSHRRATLTYLPRADAVLYLIDTQQPFTEGDAAFLGLVSEYVRVIFIVQTKIDLRRERLADGRESWQAANDRIVARAAHNAPAAEVVAVSAYDYALGVLDGDDAARERSGVPALIERVDRTLALRVQAAREASALDISAFALREAHDRTRAEAALLDRDPEQLEAERALVAARLAGDETALAGEKARNAGFGADIGARIGAAGADLRSGLTRTLSRSLDAADIARLRDRAKLHMLVDGVAAGLFGSFAARIAEETGAHFERLAAEHPGLGIRSLVAAAFGGEDRSGVWTRDLAAGMRATMVLEGIGGPVPAFVEAIAARFSSAREGAYMKRELTIDLREHFFPALEKAVDAYADGFRRRLEALTASAAGALDAEAGALRAERLDPFERVRALDRNERAIAAARFADALARIASLQAQAEALRPLEAVPDRAIVPAREDGEIGFDSHAYESGLRPQRYRVVLLGGLDRGKSALINAIAGTRLLGEHGEDEERFPIHVRYGPERRAYALAAEGEWIDIPVDTAIMQSAKSPVLIEVPWKLPRELVLVHAPAFDSGEPEAETIALAAAAHASEILMLFSRQLSDRELALIEAAAAFERPLILAHTMADVETSTDRRTVVDLANRVLTERGVKHGRIFTVSALDALDAAYNGRAAAGWNELGALRETLAAHAEEHMQRLETRARAAGGPSPATAPDPAPEGNLLHSLGRLFSRTKRT